MAEKKKGSINNEISELFEEFGSSMAANYIIHGPGDVLDMRGQLLTGCIQCGERISEFMLAQDIACALTVGDFEFKEKADRVFKGIWDNSTNLSQVAESPDGLVRAAGDTVTVLKNLKEADPKKFLQVLSILWKHQKENKRGKNNTV